MAVIVVRHQREFCVGAVGYDGVGEVPEVRIVVTLFRPDKIVFDQTQLAVGSPSGREASGFSAVIVHTIVPSVHEVTGQSELAIEGVLAAHTKMKIRNGPGE